MSDSTGNGTSRFRCARGAGWRRIVVGLLLVCAGYIAAVTAAVIVTVAIMLAPAALPDNGAQGSIFRMLSEMLPAMLVIGFFWTFICALPGFIVAIVVGERLRWNHWRRYACAGFVNAVPALAIYGQLAGSPFGMPIMVLASFPGGFVGGTVYWFAAGRFAARQDRGRIAMTEHA